MRTVGLMVILIAGFFYNCPVKAQMKFDVTANDSIRVPELFNGLNRNFFSDPDSTVYFADHIIAIAEKINNDTLWIIAKQMGGEGYRASGKFSRSLKYQLEAIGRSKELKNRRLEAISSSFLGFTYLQSGFYREGLDYCIPAFKILDSSGQKTSASFTASNAASCFTHLGNADSADIFNDLAWKIWQLTDVADQRRNALRTLIFDRVAANYELKSDYENAIFYYRQSMQFSIKDNIGVNKSMGQKNLARIFLLLNQQDSAKYFALASISKPKLTHKQLYMVESALVLDSIYRREGKLDSALYFQTIAMNVQDSIFGPRKIQELQKLMADEQELQQQRELDRSASRSRQRMLLMVGAVLVLLTTVFILRRGNRIKQHLNGELQQKNIDLEKTLDRLKSTQAQLIQSEKMASLGELTAGIAHEIQNPLNFVNNFSDVNSELVSELLSNLQNGNIKEAEGLATELGENEKKINHHGKRADTIVKSMLQHSRASNGQKELTDINAFCNEYVRLAYHGMRSRDSSFSITLNTDLNPAIGKVNINVQDLGRVIVNLLNNAFYAVQEKAKTAGENYIPEVLLKTGIVQQSNGEYFFIRIKDNGIGIPEKIKQKIFQPFFTTKPTGEGTGLGLSLSFDIIRAHGGQLQVISQEGLGSEFEIQLPV